MSAEMFIPAPPLFLSLQLYEHLSSYAGTEKNSLVEYAFQHGGLRVGSTPGFQSYRNKLALKKKKKYPLWLCCTALFQQVHYGVLQPFRSRNMCIAAGKFCSFRANE